jgi:L-amino acid N-acyltransferase YncA
MSDETQGTVYTSKAGVRYVMRDARPDELDEIYAIWKAGMEQHGYEIDPARRAKYIAYLNGMMQSQDEVFKFWVAEAENGEIAGWQALMPYGNNPFSRELGGESSTYVRPSLQAGGVAHILLYHVIAHAKTTSLHHVVAFVAEDNKAVEQIGGKLGGWQRVGVIPPSPKPPRRPGMVLHINMLA